MGKPDHYSLPRKALPRKGGAPSKTVPLLRVVRGERRKSTCQDARIHAKPGVLAGRFRFVDPINPAPTPRPERNPVPARDLRSLLSRRDVGCPARPAIVDAFRGRCRWPGFVPPRRLPGVAPAPRLTGPVR